MLFPFGDESDEDDAGSRFTIHDLCESGENVERLRKKLTFKKAETHAKDAGELDDENDEKEEGGGGGAVSRIRVVQDDADAVMNTQV